MEDLKLYSTVYNKKYFVVMANDIIKGKQSMTLQQARIIRLLISQVVKQDKDLKTYTCRIEDLANFLGIASSNLFTGIKFFCSQLLDLKVHVGTGNSKDPWEVFHWIQLAKYNGNGTMTLMLSNQIAPYVLELERYFTQYQQENILEMQSYYAIRLYELLKADRGINQHAIEFRYDIAQLRQYFCCENKYKATRDFIIKVIKISVNEINKKTDLRVIATYEKTSRAITHIIFETYMQLRK